MAPWSAQSCLGATHSMHILTPSATFRWEVNMTALAAADAAASTER